jgi:hypothetical protein
MSGRPSVPTTDRLVIRTARLDLLPINREHAAEMFTVLAELRLYEFVTG